MILRVFNKSISVRTRMMVNFARQGKLWWRLVAILTRTSFVFFVPIVISLVHVFVLKSCLRLFKSRFYCAAFSQGLDSMLQPLTVLAVGGADAKRLREERLVRAGAAQVKALAIGLPWPQLAQGVGRPSARRR